MKYQFLTSEEMYSETGECFENMNSLAKIQYLLK